MANKKVLLIAISIMAIITVTISFRALRKPVSAYDSPSGKPSVKTADVQESSIGKLILVSGFVRGEDRADLAPAASGRITSILKQEGDSVRKGEVIITIDAHEINAQVQAANANIDALNKTLKDAKKYYGQLVDQTKAAKDDAKDSDMPTDAAEEAIDSAKKGRDLQVQSIQDQITAAQGALGVAQAGRSNFSIIAPFSGTVLAVNGRVGDFANFSAPLVKLATPGSLELETYVSAADGRDISVGSTVSITDSAGAPFAGTVTAVAPGSDAASLKTLVRIHIDDETGTLMIGDFVNGSIAIPSAKPQLEIPRQAVIFRGGDPAVFTVGSDNIAHEQPVKLGTERDGSVAVLEGLSQGERIVSEGQQYLVNGITVSPYGGNE